MKTKLDFISKIKDGFNVKFPEYETIKEADRKKVIDLIEEWCNIDFIEETPYVYDYVQERIVLEGHIITLLVNNHFYDMFHE